MKSCRPRLAAHQDDIYLNRKLFAKVESLWNRREQLALNEEQSQLLKETYEAFIRAGAKLTDDEQARIREINGRLSSLAPNFKTIYWRSPKSEPWWSMMSTR